MAAIVKKPKKPLRAARPARKIRKKLKPSVIRRSKRTVAPPAARHRAKKIAPARAEDLLQALLDNIPDRIYFKDCQGRFIKCSQAVAHRLGVKDSSQVVGKTDFDFLPADRAREFFENEQEIMRSGQPLINKTQTQTTPAGENVWSSVTKVALRGKDGAILGLVGINRDITEHKRSEAALRQSNEALENRVAERTVELSRERLLLRTLIDNLPDTVYAKDLAGRKILANPADLKMCGCQAEAEVLGKMDFDFFPAELAEKFWADDLMVLHGQEVINREELIMSKSGGKHWLLTSKLPLRGPNGTIVGLIGIGRDVTLRKKAEEALSRERLLLRTLIDNLPDCIYAKDMAGRKTLANPADLKNLRCQTEAEALGKTDFDLFPPPLAEKFWADDQTVLQGQPVINREEYCFDETGEKRWLLTSKLPLRDQTGTIVGLIGVARDITVIKHAEEKLAAHMLELEQRDHQTKEELNMARELQMAMLPHEFPAVPRHKPAAESDLEFFSFFAPSGAVSGDFFDVIPLSDTAVGIFICDAMGHDVRAALVTAMMRALVADMSSTIDEPGELLNQVNRELTGIFKQSGSVMYATAFYLIVDLARAEFRYASAAHPDPILLRRKSNTVGWLKAEAGGKKGPALGLFAEGKFPTYRRAMEAGDCIALFTDGLVEVESPTEEMFNAERLLASVQRRIQMPAGELFADLIEEVRAFSGRAKFDDDLCIAGVEVKRLEAGKIA